MNLSIQDIYDRVESLKTFNGYSQDKMAELMGLSNKQAYSNMIKKKTMKLKYLVNLVNNSGESIDKFFTKSTKEQLYKNNDISSVITEPEIKLFHCQECINKQNKLEQAEKERDDYRQKYIECLEELAGKKKAVS
jgi:transcriptional regulator with XRE-family HTH domain